MPQNYIRFQNIFLLDFLFEFFVANNTCLIELNKAFFIFEFLLKLFN